jgi:hypothetical protein
MKGYNVLFGNMLGLPGGLKLPGNTVPAGGYYNTVPNENLNLG